MSDSTILFLSRPLQENVHFKFYQLVEPQATVLCSHHSLLETAGRLIKDPIPVPSRPTLWFSHLPRPSSYKSVEEPDYFLTHPSVKTRPEKKLVGLKLSKTNKSKSSVNSSSYYCLPGKHWLAARSPAKEPQVSNFQN